MRPHHLAPLAPPLDVKKKGLQLFGGRMCTLRENAGFATALNYVGMPPEWLIRPALGLVFRAGLLNVLFSQLRGFGIVINDFFEFQIVLVTLHAELCLIMHRRCIFKTLDVLQWHTQ